MLKISTLDYQEMDCIKYLVDKSDKKHIMLIKDQNIQDIPSTLLQIQNLNNYMIPH